MRRIESIKDLRSERARLKLELSVAEELLDEDLEWVKSELNPVHLAGKFLSHSMIRKDNGIVNDGLGKLIDVLLKSGLLSRSGWIVKLVVPYLVKNISSNYINEKKPEFFGMLKRLISKTRKSINHNHNHYDMSTVDEMDY